MDQLIMFVPMGVKKKETANAANYTDGVAKGPIVL